MIPNEQVLHAIQLYVTRHPSEAGHFRELVHRLRNGTDVWSRGSFSGHITCSAIILNSASYVLLIHHRTLDRWLFPGGHVEICDTSLEAAAKREAQEEIGISRSNLAPMTWEDIGVPVDINHHIIPENSKKGEPAHWHWDFRFLFRTGNESFTGKHDEIVEAAWRPVSSLLNVELQNRIERAWAMRGMTWQKTTLSCQKF